MKKNLNRDYAINFKALELGSHYYKFNIGDKFFEELDTQDYKKGKVTAIINMTKESTMLVLDIVVKGTVEVVCDRCLEKFNQDFEGSFKLIVKFGDKPEEITDEIVIIPYEEHTLNMSHYLYEYIVLSLPFRHVHPDDENGFPTCNPDMLKRLDNLNIKTETRWDALKNIKFD
jgi:uncharacterized metal-binding protein YceD (DUF177 family)